jgi:RHS repeat-associated protein
MTEAVYRQNAELRSAPAGGNMSCAASPAETKCIALTYSPTTNRITTSGYSYDSAGNLTGDGTYTYQWDAEARLTKVSNGAASAISTNTYNALGQRVRDVTTSNTTDEAYGADGALLWRYTGSSTDPNQRAFVPFGGRILAEYYSGGTIFDHPDEIGSMTTSSDYTGKNFNEKLFYPFGEFWTGATVTGSSTSFNMHQTFAQLPDYDSETDQYNTPNRHYNPTGRWLSPDPGGLKALNREDPQTWNMYAYTRNNPTTFTDPTGLCTVDGENHNWVWCAAHAIGWVQTQQERNAEIETERTWLITNVARNASQAAALRGASGSQVQQLYRQWDAALMQAQCGGLWGCETWIPASGLKRADNGSFVPLTRLHSDATIMENNPSGYEFWKNKTTAEIIESLKPGSEYGPLTVKPNGTVMQGNTRIKILEERGVDVNQLERVILEAGEELP